MALSDDVNALIEASSERHAAGALPEAIAAYRRILELKPDFPAVCNNLGAALRQAGMLDEAAYFLRRAVAGDPRSADAHANLGLVLKDLGRADEALDFCLQAVSLRTDFGLAYNSLGLVFEALGQKRSAESAFRQALDCACPCLEAHNNLANLLHERGRLSEAAEHFRRALDCRPDFPEVHNNLAMVLSKLGMIGQAIGHYDRALAARPDFAVARSNMLIDLQYVAGLPQQQIFAAARQYAERLEGSVATPAFANRRDPDRRLRIGYVSPDFRDHSVAYFFEPLLAHHDADAVESVCYAQVGRPDGITERLRGLADHWVSTVGMHDAVLIERIRRDEIDILVDLAGHTRGNRLTVFARRAAPIQVTWLGFPNTTGLTAIDYRLVDAWTDPPGDASEPFHSERLIRLAGGFLCYRPPDVTPDVSRCPLEANSFVTFASFNNPAKLSDPTLVAWSAILALVPGSRLLLKGLPFADVPTCDQFKSRLAAFGIAPERVALIGQVAGMAEHLALYGHVDIALDPFPYNGTTTSCEALWMGVPVVTLSGDRHAGRVGVSLLSQIGFEHLVGRSVDDYVRIATALASDGSALSALRGGLRARMAASTLCDGARFARKVEEAYLRMWRFWTFAEPSGRPLDGEYS